MNGTPLAPDCISNPLLADVLGQSDQLDITLFGWARPADKGGLVADEHGRCPKLLPILGPHLHQDFDLEFACADRAMVASLRVHSIDTLEAAPHRAAELSAALIAEASSRQFVNRLGDYDPPGDNLSDYGWLDRLDAEFVRATGRSDSRAR